MNTQNNKVIDVHMHVGLKGDRWRELGHFSESYQNELVYEIFLLYGSDIPTPVFELSADIKENWEDFKAILKGDFSRIIIPQDNLLDINYKELKYYFPGHPMFTNFNALLR